MKSKSLPDSDIHIIIAFWKFTLIRSPLIYVNIKTPKITISYKLVFQIEDPRQFMVHFI